MSQKLLELRRSLGETTSQLRGMLNLVETEKRSFSAEEQPRWDALNADIERYETQIAAEERVSELEARGATVVTEAPRPNPADGGTTERGANRGSLYELRGIRQPGQVPFEQRWNRVDADEEVAKRQRQIRQFLRGDLLLPHNTVQFRALQADEDISGGFTVRVEDFMARLIQGIDDTVYMRQYGTVMSVTSADSIGVPSLDADVEDADWTGEITTADEDTAMTFGKRDLHPHALKKLIKVSKKLLRTSAIDAEALVRERLGYKFSLAAEKGYLTGNGAGQPLGVFTASASGVSTGRDISTGNSTTAVAADGLVNALYSLKEGYQRRARWLFHRTVIRDIRKLKDGDGQYLWQPGLAGGQPSTILDKPYGMSEWTPNTMTTGLYVGIVGDFSYYWIADAMQLSVQRLVELYAASSQDGFIGEMYSDGMPVLEEAFARVKLA